MKRKMLLEKLIHLAFYVFICISAKLMGKTDTCEMYGVTDGKNGFFSQVCSLQPRGLKNFAIYITQHKLFHSKSA